jgi:hypothetical protein
VFAHAKEAADAQNDLLDLAGLIQNDIIDVADLLVGLVVDIHADEFGCAPFALSMRRGGAIAGRALVRVGRLGRCCPGEQG